MIANRIFETQMYDLFLSQMTLESKYMQKLQAAAISLFRPECFRWIL